MVGIMPLGERRDIDKATSTVLPVLLIRAAVEVVEPAIATAPIQIMSSHSMQMVVVVVVV
jgi:hypothetical protein